MHLPFKCASCPLVQEGDGVGAIHDCLLGELLQPAASRSCVAWAGALTWPFFLHSYSAGSAPCAAPRVQVESVVHSCDLHTPCMHKLPAMHELIGACELHVELAVCV